jgi:predicted RND superfamily exporter protein
MHFLLTHRRLVWVLLAGVTLGLGALARDLQFDFSPQALYAGDDDLLTYAEAFRADFGYEDAVVLVLIEAQDAPDALAPPALAWMRRAGAACAEVPHVFEVESVAGLAVPRAALAGGTDLTPVPLLPPGTIREADAARLRAALAVHQPGPGITLSTDRRLAALLISLDPARRTAKRMHESLVAIRAALDAHPLPPGYTRSLTGMPVMRDDIVTDLGLEQGQMIPLVAVIFFFVMWLAFRRFLAALLLLLAVAVGVTWSGGAFVALGERLNIMGHILPILLCIIGVANGVHVFNRYEEELALTPGEPRAALARAMSVMTLACLLTFFTTAVGFLSLTLAHFPVLQAIGRQTAVGLILVYVSTVLVLGTLLYLLPYRVAATSRRRRGAPRVILGRIGKLVTRRPRLILLISAVALASAAIGAGGLDVNSWVLEAYDSDHPANRTMELVEDRLGGVLTINVALEADEEAALLEPAALERVDGVAQWARARPEVLLARSYVDIHHAIRRSLPVARDVGQSAEGVAQIHELARELGQLAHYERFVARNTPRARLMLQVRDVGTRELLVFSRALETRLAESGLAPGIRTRLTGVGYGYAHALDGFIRDVLFSLWCAAAIIFFVIALLFRSIRLGLISIIPNVTPLVLTLGYMALRDIPLNTSSVIVFAIGLGVAVDDTIHFLARYREERGRALDIGPAIRATLRGAGRSMILTTVLMVLGLALLHTSQFVPTRRFAELTSVLMGSALLGDLFLLPACLQVFRARAGAKAGTRPAG